MPLDQDSTLKNRTSIINTNIMETVKPCIQVNVFQKFNKLYKQVDGSPISVVIAELTMQYNELTMKLPRVSEEQHYLVRNSR